VGVCTRAREDTGPVSAREDKRIAAARKRHQYWEAQLLSFRQDDALATAYRWLCALRKVNRSRWGGAANVASVYGQEASEHLLQYARAISRADQMTAADAEAYWRRVSDRKAS